MQETAVGEVRNGLIPRGGVDGIDLRQISFSIVEGGYEPLQVDELLLRLDREVRAVVSRARNDVDLTRDADVGARADRDAADALMVDARTRAACIVADAQRQATELIAAARQEAARIVASASITTHSACEDVPDDMLLLQAVAADSSSPAIRGSQHDLTNQSRECDGQASFERSWSVEPDDLADEKFTRFFSNGVEPEPSRTWMLRDLSSTT